MCAVVVVEGATLATFVTGTITMIIIGILLNIVGLGIFCWALFALATHALPFFVGMTVGDLFISSWSRSVRRHRRWLRRGCITLVAGRYRFLRRALSDRPPGHWAVIRGFRRHVPAMRVTFALAHIGIPSEWWRESFAVLGAIAIGGTAWARMSMQTDPALRRGVATRPYSATAWGGDHGRVISGLRRLSVGMERG